MKRTWQFSLLAVFWLALLLGTSEPPQPPHPVITPFDGQTCVAPDAPVIIAGLDKGLLYPDMPSLEEAVDLVDSANQPVPHTLEFGSKMRSIILRPNSPWQNGEVYTVSGIFWSRVKSSNVRPIRTDFRSGEARFEVEGKPKLLQVLQDYSYGATTVSEVYLVFSEPVDLSSVNIDSIGIVTTYTQPISSPIEGTDGTEYMRSVSNVEVRQGFASSNLWQNFPHIVAVKFDQSFDRSGLHIHGPFLTPSGRLFTIPDEIASDRRNSPPYNEQYDAAGRTTLDYYAVAVGPCGH